MARNPLVRSLPKRVKWLSVTTADPIAVRDIYAGDIEITDYTEQTTSAWREYQEIGELTPVSVLTATPGTEVSISGILVPGRLNAGRDVVNYFRDIVGERVKIQWVLDNKVAHYQVVDVTLTRQGGHALVDGGTFSIQLRQVTDATTAPTTAPPPAQVTPLLAPIATPQSVTIGTAVHIPLSATVGFGDGEPYYITATGLPAGLAVAGKAIAGTATASAVSGDATISLVARGGGPVSTLTVRFDVQPSAAPPVQPPPAPTPAVRLGDMSAGVAYSLSAQQSLNYAIPLIAPDGGALATLPDGWGLDIDKSTLPAGLDFAGGKVTGDITGGARAGNAWVVTVRLTGATPASAQLEIRVVA